MRLSLLLVPAAAVAAFALASCGGDGGDASPTSAATSPATTAPLPTATVDEAPSVNGLKTCLPPGTQVKGSPFAPNANPLGQPETLAVIPAAQLHVGANNLAIGLQDRASLRPIGGAQVRITVYDLGGGQQKPVCQVEGTGSAPGVGPASEHVHGDGTVHVHGGQDADRAVHYAHVTFDRAGNWGLAVEAILRDGTRAFGTVLVEVGREPTTPAPGEPALKSDNLTRNDVADIREIDSGDPPNDMHDLKIRDVINAGRPLVIVFATPAYCTSAFCGPVTEEVEDLYEEFKDRVDFIHIEIYRDFNASPPVLNPTAREWLLQPDGRLVEPVVYVVGRDGIIYDRWEGPVARNIMEPSVRAVAKGAVYSH